MHNSSILTFTEGAAFKKTSLLLWAVSHPLRIRILNFIGQNQPVNVNSIYKDLVLDQSITSQHLKILKDSALVMHERKGKEVYYTLHIDNLTHVAKLVYNYFGKK